MAFWEQTLDALGAAEIRNQKAEQSIETEMEWIKVSATPSLEKIRRSIGDDIYYEWLSKQMEEVELRQKAIDQIAAHHRAHGVPDSEVSF